MSKHTPGPWPTRESATHVTVTNARGDAVFHDDKRIPGVMADARLIAAAPELLEALVAAEERDEENQSFAEVERFHKRAGTDIRSEFDYEYYRRLKQRAAIAKATGGAA